MSVYCDCVTKVTKYNKRGALTQRKTALVFCVRRTVIYTRANLNLLTNTQVEINELAKQIKQLRSAAKIETAVKLTAI